MQQLLQLISFATVVYMQHECMFYHYCIYVYIYVNMFMRLYVYLYIHVFVYICLYMYRFIYVHALYCVCVYSYNVHMAAFANSSLRMNAPPSSPSNRHPSAFQHDCVKRHGCDGG